VARAGRRLGGVVAQAVLEEREGGGGELADLGSEPAGLIAAGERRRM